MPVKAKFMVKDSFIGGRVFQLKQETGVSLIERFKKGGG
jgi:hypothetical protein